MAKNKAPASFEEALAELEALVAQMEGGQLTLESSLTAYGRGTELLKFCQTQLADAQQKVQVLSAGELAPFELPTSERTQ